MSSERNEQRAFVKVGMLQLQRVLFLHLLLTIAVLETLNIEKNVEKKNLDENEKNLLDVMDGKVFISYNNYPDTIFGQSRYKTLLFKIFQLNYPFDKK